MKALITGLLTIIMYLATGASFIWAIVEFILYLVKDKPFDWWSVWSILICGFISIILFVLCAFYAAKIESEKRNKGTFQSRLNDMEKKRKGL